MCNPRRLSLSIAWGQLAWYSCTLAVLATWAAVVLLHLRTWGLPHVGVGWSERLADLVGGCMHDLSPLYVHCGMIFSTALIQNWCHNYLNPRTLAQILVFMFLPVFDLACLLYCSMVYDTLSG